MGLKLSLQGRLLASFCALFGVCVLLSAVGVAALRRVGGALTRSALASARQIQLAGGVQEGIQEMRSKAQSIQLALTVRLYEEKEQKGGSLGCGNCHNQEEIARNRSSFLSTSDRVKGQLAELKATAEEPDAAAHAEATRREVAEWEAAFVQYADLASSGRFDEAHSLVTDRLSPLQADILKRAAQAQQRANDYLESRSREEASHVNRITGVMMLLIACALAVGGASIGGVRRSVRALTRIAGRLRNAMATVLHSAREMASASDALAAGASQQAARIEETSRRGQQVAEAARQNRQRAVAAQQQAAEAAELAGQATQRVQQLESAMEELTAANSRIAHVLKVIEEIAFQTNLLALNAAVEAARAGEAGAGFAVVAGEVRQLAVRCAQAAKETAELVAESHRKADLGRTVSAQTGEVIQAIAQEAGKVGRVVAEFRSGSEGQAEAMNGIQTSLQQIERLVQHTASQADQGAAEAQRLQEASCQLQESVLALDSLLERAR